MWCPVERRLLNSSIIQWGGAADAPPHTASGDDDAVVFSCEGCGKARRFCDRVDLVCDFAEHGIVRFQEGGAGFLIRKGRRECDAGDLSVFNVNHGRKPFSRVLDYGYLKSPVAGTRGSEGV